MTTIVYRDGVMCGDTAVFDRGTYCGQAVKVHKNKDGWLFGAAGSLGEMAAFRDWFYAGMEGPCPNIKDDQTEVLIVDPSGKTFWYGLTDIKVQLDGDFQAIGSGFQVAMGAMAAGADAYEAISIAARLDHLTRQPVHSVRINEYPHE